MIGRPRPVYVFFVDLNQSPVFCLSHTLVRTVGSVVVYKHSQAAKPPWKIIKNKHSWTAILHME